MKLALNSKLLLIRLFGSANLERPLLQFTSATDASTSLGLGVCVALASEHVARQLAGYVEKWGDYGILDDASADAGSFP